VTGKCGLDHMDHYDWKVWTGSYYRAVWLESVDWAIWISVTGKCGLGHMNQYDWKVWTGPYGSV
jgi:hypothetical protein